MAKFKQLRDLYRFPGFVPLARLRGIFGDPRAVVITLRRRRKKRFAARVGRHLGPTTTSGHGGPGTSPVATSAFTWPIPGAASNVYGVAA